MANPQQPELARSRKTPSLDPDATEAVLSAAEAPTVDRASGPVPVENQPGHHPPVEQDKPDPDRFLAKVKEVAAEADGFEADDGADAVQVGPSVEATTAAVVSRNCRREIRWGAKRFMCRAYHSRPAVARPRGNLAVRRSTHDSRSSTP